MSHSSANTLHDDPLSFAIQQQLVNTDLRGELDALRPRLKTLEAKLKQAEKAAKEAQQHKDRADRLRAKLDSAEKDMKQVRHRMHQQEQKARAELERAKREKDSDKGPHATIKSEDGKCIVQLAYNQVHIHEPERWYMVSSQPLHKAEKSRVVFCGLIDGIRAGDYAGFVDGAVGTLAAKWRAENNRLRVEDLDLSTKTMRRLEDAGIEMLEELQVEGIEQQLLSIKGIGPATVKQVMKAAAKEAR